MNGLPEGFDAAESDVPDPQAWSRDRLPPEKPEPETENPPLWYDDDAWDEAAIPRRPWLVPDLLLRGAVTLMAGPGGSSKSLFCVSLAISTALGKPLGRFQAVQPCRVLLLNVEDDFDEQRRRFSASLRQFGATPRDVKGRVRRVGPTGLGTLFATVDGKGGPARFDPTPAMRLLERWVTEFKPDIVILDPLVELHDGDENSNTALRAVVANFRSFAVRHNVAVMVLHHTRKGSASPGDPDGARGASAIIGAARVVVTVNAMSEEDAKALGRSPDQRRHHFRVDDAKANYGPLHAACWFEKVVHRLGNDEDVPAATPWTPPQDVITSELMGRIEAGIKRGTARGLPWSSGKGGGERAIKNLLNEHGVTTEEGATKVQAKLKEAGFRERYFKGDDRHRAKGYQSPEGLPDTVEWLD